MKYRIPLLITASGKVVLDVSENGSIYLEIFKKIGEVERNGRKLPLFYDNGKKDSKVAKMNISEMSTVEKGFETFALTGISGFQDYARSISNGKYENLLFVHEGGKLAGLRAFNGKNDRAYIGFLIQEKDTKYGVYTDDLVEIEGIITKLGFALNKAMENKYSFSPKVEEEINEEFEEDFDSLPKP